jgi:hypothetical protein
MLNLTRQGRGTNRECRERNRRKEGTDCYAVDNKITGDRGLCMAR